MISRNDSLSIYGLYLYQTDLFDKFKCPTGLDLNLVIDSIVLENAELELLYPDADFMKEMIGLWSRKEQVVWQKMVDTLALEYNPIWNKDGLIKETRDVDSSSSGESTTKVSAYNEAGFHDRSSDSSSGSGNSKETIERRETGNIGVTTSQEMIKEELEIRKTNVIDYIVKSFRQRFCLLVY